MLAAEPRTVQAVDVDSKRPVYVPLRVTLKSPAAPAAAHALSPAPPLDGLSLGANPLPVTCGTLAHCYNALCTSVPCRQQAGRGVAHILVFSCT